MLKKAQQDQKKRGDTYLGVDVLLLALLGDSEVSAAITESGITKHSIENALKDVRPSVCAQQMGPQSFGVVLFSSRLLCGCATLVPSALAACCCTTCLIP